MFIGSFHRVVSRGDIDRQVPMGSAPAVILVEDEQKLYERNNYGLLQEYPIKPKEPISTCHCIDHTDEITDMEERLHKLEVSMKSFTGGKLDEI